MKPLFLHCQAYRTPSSLHFGEHVILSSCGVQQGDPLGPVFFALVVDGCARSLKAPLNVWYLDDATIAGPAETVAKDLKTLCSELPKLGLELNRSKCELTINSGTPAATENIANTISSVLPDIKIIHPEQLTLLGSPLHHEGLSDFVRSAHTTISRLCTRICLLDRAHCSFLLVEVCICPEGAVPTSFVTGLPRSYRIIPNRQHCPPHAPGGVQRGNDR